MRGQFEPAFCVLVKQKENVGLKYLLFVVSIFVKKTTSEKLIKIRSLIRLNTYLNAAVTIWIWEGKSSPNYYEKGHITHCYVQYLLPSINVASVIFYCFLNNSNNIYFIHLETSIVQVGKKEKAIKKQNIQR